VLRGKSAMEAARKQERALHVGQATSRPKQVFYAMSPQQQDVSNEATKEKLEFTICVAHRLGHLHNGNLGEKSVYVYLAVAAGVPCLLKVTLQCSAGKKFGNHWSKVIRPLRKGLNKPLYDVTFTRRFLRGKQMTACDQIRLCAVVRAPTAVFFHPDMDFLSPSGWLV